MTAELFQNDPEALNRRCQTFEALDKVEQTYSDAKAVHNYDPKKQCYKPVLLHLHLVFNVEEELDKREKAADNMIVLAKEMVGDRDSVWRPWQD